MSSPDQQTTDEPTAETEIAHGAVIDPSGREIPITEGMIQDACSELEKELVEPPKDSAPE